MYDSPRQMDNLAMIKRKGRPPLLIESRPGRRGSMSGARMIVHWVLMSQVVIPPSRWLSRGAQAARGAMVNAFADRLNEYLDQWEKR